MRDQFKHPKLGLNRAETSSIDGWVGEILGGSHHPLRIVDPKDRTLPDSENGELTPL